MLFLDAVADKNAEEVKRLEQALETVKAELESSKKEAQKLTDKLKQKKKKNKELTQALSEQKKEVAVLKSNTIPAASPKQGFLPFHFIPHIRFVQHTHILFHISDSPKADQRATAIELNQTKEELENTKKTLKKKTSALKDMEKEMQEKSRLVEKLTRS